MNSQTFHITNIKQTENLSSFLAKYHKIPMIILLSGPLGIGKTKFVQFFAETLCVNEKVTSPSFLKMHIYHTKNNKKIIHLDGYHLKNYQNFHEFSDFLDNEYILIEWPEKFLAYLPKKTLIKINFSWIGKSKERMLTITGDNNLINYLKTININ